MWYFLMEFKKKDKNKSHRIIDIFVESNKSPIRIWGTFHLQKDTDH